jgi:uncharacterized protein DUF6768
MNMLDTRIEELSSETDMHLLRASHPHGWLGVVREMRNSRLAWVFWSAWVAQLVLLVLGIWWAVEFFRATEVLAALKLGLSAATALILAMQLKVGIGPHLHAERMLREMKRLEIMVLARNRGD